MLTERGLYKVNERTYMRKDSCYIPSTVSECKSAELMSGQLRFSIHTKFAIDSLDIHARSGKFTNVRQFVSILFEAPV